MGNRIVITGASSLIGQAIAKRIVANNDYVILQCFKNSNACKHFIESPNWNCEILTADFSNSNELINFCEKLKDIDILVNCAAYTKADILPNLQNHEINCMIRVNIEALIAICRAVLPGMIVKRRGIIVNISSVAALRGNRGQSVYAGTKGFVESFTRSLAAEYGGKGIRANCVAPGAIDAGSLKEMLSYAPDEVRKSMVSTRLGNPEDVAAAVSFLCSNDASFINGKCIPVDGGFMRGV